MRNQRFELMCTFGTSLAAASRLSEDAPMLIFILLGHAPLVLVLTLVVALYLTVVELREFRPHYASSERPRPFGSSSTRRWTHP